MSLRPAALDGWAYADPDGDSISNYEEFMLGTDPSLADSDGDGPSDRWELEHGFGPMVAQFADPDVDTDGDLIPDGWEAWLGSDPNNPNSGRWDCIDYDGDGFVAWYENLVLNTSDAQANAPELADEDHVDIIALVDSTRPCVLSLTGPDQYVDIPWVPGVSPASLRLRLRRGEQYQVVLSRAPAGSGLSTNGFWWANVNFEAPPEFWCLNGPETVADGVLAYNAHTVQIETPFRPAYDIWLVPGTTGLPVFDLAAIRLLIDGPLVFCHNTSYAEIALTADSLVTGPVDWTGLPPVTPAQANPLVFDPSTMTPGAYTVVATAADNPWTWAECQVEIHSLAFAESVIWLSATDTNTHTIALAPGSFPTSGLDVWSEPAGIDSLDITPSEIDPGSYTVYAWGACGGVEVQVNVIKVDLDIGSVSDADEETVGGFVPVNADNDNGSTVTNHIPATRDFDADGYTDDDLVPISLSLQPTTGLSGTLRLRKVESGRDRIKVWETTGKATEVPLPKTWTVGTDTIPATLYVEGLKEGQALRDIDLFLEFLQGGAVLCDDKVKVTVTPVLKSLQATGSGNPWFNANQSLVFAGTGIGISLTGETYADGLPSGVLSLIQHCKYDNHLADGAGTITYFGTKMKVDHKDAAYRGMALVDTPASGTLPWYVLADGGTPFAFDTADNPQLAIVAPQTIDLVDNDPSSKTLLDASFLFDIYVAWTFDDEVVYFLGKSSWSVRYAGYFRKVGGAVVYTPEAHNAITNSSGYYLHNTNERTQGPTANDQIGDTWVAP